MILFLFLLFSCSNKKNATSTQESDLAVILNEISYAESLTEINKNYVNSKNKILRPSESWQKMLQFNSRSSALDEKKIFCLFYRIPGPNPLLHPGLLRLFQTHSESPCQDSHFGQNNEVKWEVMINDLSLYATGEEGQSLDRLTKIPPWSFLIQGQLYAEGGRTWPLVQSTTLLNASWVTPRKKKEWPEFSNGRGPGKFPGLKFYPLKEKKIAESPAVKDLSLKEGDKCHELADDCQEMNGFSCDACPGPWYEVVGSGCVQEYEKVCGPNQCGFKGMSACPSGKKNLPEVSRAEICRTDSPYGFCARGLRTFCQDGKLVCL